MPDVNLEETELLRHKIAEAFLAQALPYGAFELLLTSAVTMGDPGPVITSVQRAREARALARLRAAAEMCP